MDNQITVNELLRSVGQLSVRDFEAFFIEIQSLRAQKSPLQLNEVEHRLLKQINGSLLSSKQMRFNYLIARRDAQIITESEFSELLKLTDEIEKNDNIRLKRIAKLAEIKGFSLSDVVRVYNIKPYQHG